MTDEREERQKARLSRMELKTVQSLANLGILNSLPDPGRSIEVRMEWLEIQQERIKDRLEEINRGNQWQMQTQPKN